MLQERKINEIKNDTEFTLEEGYDLTDFYVRYYWATNKFYSLKNQFEVEDVVHDLYIKFIERNLFGKYNNKITSKKYYVMNAVRNGMIDMLRKYRETISLEQKLTEDGMCLMDVIPDETDTEHDVIERIDREASYHAEKRQFILDSLPDTTDSKIVGFSPLMNCEVNISYRVLALHLEVGYTVKMLAEMYRNPKTGNPITQGNVSKHIANMREFLLDTVPLY